MRYLILAAAGVLLAAMGLVGSPAEPASGAPSPCVGLGGTDNAQMCHVRTSAPTYALDLSFPADYPDEQALIDYVAQNRDGFVTVVQGSPRRDQPYQMVATTDQYSAGQPPHNTRSVVLKLFQDLGGARSSTWYKAFNYNLGTKQPITFDTLFPPDTSALDSIFPIVQRELTHQTPLGAAILPSTGLDPTHYQNFAITDDQLIFYFAPGELLPSIAGTAQVQVPRSAIPPLAL